MTKTKKIVLASGSPRRRELLEALGLNFEVVVSDADESSNDQEGPEEMALRLAESKARAVASERPEAMIIAADTLVVLDGDVLTKPASSQHAVETLLRLRGREHIVHTGLAVLCLERGVRELQLATTPVVMRDYTEAEILAYVASGDPMDKAGAYAIQAGRFEPVEAIRQCYANVMGLPLCHLTNVLGKLAIPVLRNPLHACPYALLHGGCEWAHAIQSA